MKRIITKGALLVAVLAAISAELIYPRALKIVDLDYTADTVTVTTATGAATYTMQGCEDYEIGDIITAIMYSNGTPDDYSDDRIIAARYSGWTD